MILHFQSVEDLPTQIIRECAYTGDKHLDGMRKQGNKAVKLLYYQCENANGVSSSSTNSFHFHIGRPNSFAYLTIGHIK